MVVARLVIWFVATISGFAISFVFALAYGYMPPLAAILAFSAIATVIWIYSLFVPLALPVYKGILPALFPIVGLLLFGLLGFGLGWLLAGLCQCIADFQRYDHLSQMTGGAPPVEIIPLQAIGILISGFAIGIWFAHEGCPWFQSGEDFLVTFIYTFFLEDSSSVSETQRLLRAIFWIGGFFASTRQFCLIMMATLFSRPQIPRIP